MLERLKAGATQVQLAEGYGIGSSTVGDTKKNEAKIRSFAFIMASVNMSKKGCKVMRLIHSKAEPRHAGKQTRSV